MKHSTSSFGALVGIHGVRHWWQKTHAPPFWVQAWQVSSYLARGIEGTPSEGSRALPFPNLTSGVQTAHVTWTQLLSAVRFSGSLGLTGRFISSCFLR